MPLIKIIFNGHNVPGVTEQDVESLKDVIGHLSNAQVRLELGRKLERLLQSSRSESAAAGNQNIDVENFRAIEARAHNESHKKLSLSKKECDTLLEDVGRLSAVDQQEIATQKQTFDTRFLEQSTQKPNGSYDDAELIEAYSQLNEEVLRRKRLQHDIDSGQIIFPNFFELEITFASIGEAAEVNIEETSSGKLKVFCPTGHPLEKCLELLKIPLDNPVTIDLITEKYEAIKKEKGDHPSAQLAAEELRKFFRRKNAEIFYKSLQSDPARLFIYKDALHESILPAVLEKFSAYLNSPDLFFVPKHEEVVITVSSDHQVAVQIPGRLVLSTEDVETDAILTSKLTIGSVVDVNEVTLEAIGEAVVVEKLKTVAGATVIEDDKIGIEVLKRHFLAAPEREIYMTRAFNRSDRRVSFADKYLAAHGGVIFTREIDEHIQGFSSYIKNEPPITGMLRWIKGLVPLLYNFAKVFFDDPEIKELVEKLYQGRENQQQSRTKFYYLMSLNIAQLIGSKIEEGLRGDYPEFFSIEGEFLKTLLNSCFNHGANLVIPADNSDDFALLKAVTPVIEDVISQVDVAPTQKLPAASLVQPGDAPTIRNRILQDVQKYRLMSVYHQVRNRLAENAPIFDVIHCVKSFARGDERVIPYFVEKLITGSPPGDIDLLDHETGDDPAPIIGDETDYFLMSRLLTFVNYICPDDARLQETLFNRFKPSIPQKEDPLQRKDFLKKQWRKHYLLKIQNRVDCYLQETAGDALDFSTYKASRKWYQPIHRNVETAFLMRKIISDSFKKERSGDDLDAGIERLYFLRQEEVSQNDGMFNKVLNFFTLDLFTGIRKGWFSRVLDKITFGAWSQLGGSQLYRSTADMLGKLPAFVRDSSNISQSSRERYLPKKEQPLYKLLKTAKEKSKVPKEIKEALALIDKYELFERVDGGHTCSQAVAIKIQSVGQSLPFSGTVNQKLIEVANEINPLPRPRLKRSNSVIDALPGFMSPAHMRRSSSRTSLDQTPVGAKKRLFAFPEPEIISSAPSTVLVQPPLTDRSAYIQWLQDSSECKSAEDAEKRYAEKVQDVQRVRDQHSLSVLTKSPFPYTSAASALTPTDKVRQLTPPAASGSDGSESARTESEPVVAV